MPSLPKESRPKACAICGTDLPTIDRKSRTCSFQCASKLSWKTRQNSGSRFVILSIRNRTIAIPLSHGKYSIIDMCDARQAQYKWSYSVGCAVRYAFIGNRLIGRKHVSILLHREILEAPDGVEVDHKDLDPLNNRRSNLRLANSSQQKANQGLKITNSSGIKGVTWDKSRKLWIAQVGKDYRNYHIGRFANLKDAAAARRSFAEKLFGEFSRETLDPGEYGVRQEEPQHV